uniref:Diacylglycerol kinase accessory domain-containing protein n=1 Tax=Craspedostauros australis TaxID=1486917 RepID=A0A7R9ZRF4_9STRA|mmetsp:Transcript_7029/g.19077  ORF Transcript_7029/g.19077 Transcript_7029/m.19077 type:complete len:241 (+) Transcript_7029:262-984(+)
MLNIDSYAGGMPLWATATKLHQPQQQQQKVDRRGQLKRSWSLGSIGKIPKRNSAFDRIDSFEDLRYLDLSEEERYHHVTSCERPSSCQDGLLDIVTVRGTFHLGQIRVGLSHANRLCQCREARIVMKRKNPVQIDGEPWRQDACTLHVHRKRDAAIMLHRSANENIGVETEMANLLDWAQEKSYINEDVHATMMKEFSRRIESKIRQRRVKSQDNIMGSLKRAIGSTNTFQQTKDKPVMF